VLGPPAEGVGPADLGELIATVIRNSNVEQRAAFADAGDDPAEVLRVVAERLALVGEELRQGEVIIAGSLTPIVFVEPGDAIEVNLGRLGSLGLEFA
jgi:2-keto-4-pentenoate hydratase